MRAGLTVERAIVVDDQMRTIDDRDIYAVGECAQHRGQVYGLVAPLWEQAAVLADHLTGTDRTPPTTARGLATKLKVMGVELAVDGLTATRNDDDDEVVQFSEPRRGIYKKLIVRDGKLVGAILLGDISKVAFLMQAFDRGLPLPEDRVVAAVRPRHRRRRQSAPPRLADDAQVCNCNGVTKGAIGRLRDAAGCAPSTAVMDTTRAGTGCGSCKGLVGQTASNGPPAARSRTIRRANYYVPGIPLAKPELMQADPRSRNCARCRRSSPRWRRRRGGRRQQAGPGLAAAR